MVSKAWKISASVIIALRSPLIRVGAPKVTDTLSRVAKDDLHGLERNNLQILSLRRGATDKYLPGTHVFPGGNLDEFDLNPEWLDLFQSFGFDQNSFQSISDSKDVDFTQYLSKESDPHRLPGWLALRLCAIREAFEESGILLCRTPDGVSPRTPWASFAAVRELESWQHRVRSDPSQMIALCRAEGCVPDVWSLHLWSNWLTPTQQRLRYNAVFFMAVLRSQPPHLLDHTEMDELKWSSAYELVQGARTGKHKLFNPQLYESSRLSVFTDADTLVAFAASRAREGCPCWMPVQERTQDGMLFLLPGDSAYPQEVDMETPKELNVRTETFEELRNLVKRSGGTLHRMELKRADACPRIIVYNYIPPHRHVLPVTFENNYADIRSKMRMVTWPHHWDDSFLENY